MRIVKQAACSALRDEMSKLSTQSQRCQQQMSSLSGFGLGGMQSTGLTALEQRVHMQSAIATAHLQFFRSLLSADRRNSQLVSALPTTSSGVLDTDVAQERIDKAQKAIETLRDKQGAAVDQANRTNRTLSEALAVGDFARASTISWVDVGKVRHLYDSLISAQQLIVDKNERILEKARAYERQASSIYGSVDTTYLAHASSSAEQYVQTGSWGPTTWVAKMHLGLAATATTEGGSMGKVDNRDLLQVFLDGDLEQTTTFASASASGTTDFLGVALNGVASGSVLGLAVSLKPYLSTSDVVKEKGRSVGVGARASAEVYGAEGSAKATFGQTKAEVSGKALSGCLSGTLGASLFKSGSPHPSLAAELDIAGTGLEGGASLKVGDAERNYRLRAKGEVLTTETEAGIEVGTSGIEVKAGNEAYVATGEVTGGITLFGVKVDATVEGKYGGAGAKAGAKIGDDSVEGTFGAGLGLGLGVKVKVDWSGAGKTFGSVRDQVGSWWNDLGKQVMN